MQLNYEETVITAKNNILATCCQFAHRYKNIIQAKRFDEMVKAMQTTDSLMIFSCHVRQTIVDNNEIDSTFNSGPFWAIIDAINFFYDGVTNHWKFMNINDKIRHLNWSMEKCAESLWLETVNLE
jgi:hypothetical protein